METVRLEPAVHELYTRTLYVALFVGPHPVKILVFPSHKHTQSFTVLVYIQVYNTWATLMFVTPLSLKCASISSVELRWYSASSI